MVRKSLIFLLTTITFSGFINNFIDIFSFNLSTLIVDVLIVFLLAFILNKKREYVSPRYVKLLKFYFFLLILGLIKLLLDSNPFDERLLGFRNYFVYSLMFFFIPSSLNENDELEDVVLTWVKCCFIICSFSIIQGLFYSSLPSILLTPKSDKLFTFYDSNLIRTNGLIGNPINFTGFAVLFLSIAYNLFLTFRKKVYFIYCVIGLVALYLTYSRVAYIGVVVIGGVSYLFNREISIQKKLKNILLFFLISLSAVAIFYDRIVSNSSNIFIVQRLLGNEETTQSSNEEHLLDTYNASNAIVENILFGVGLGTQGESAKGERIITDGSWFHFFLELGAPLASLFIVFILLNLMFVSTIVRTTRLTWVRSLGLAFISFTFFLLVVSFVNSIFIARVIYLQYWFLLGVIIAGFLNERRSLLDNHVAANFKIKAHN